MEIYRFNPDKAVRYKGFYYQKYNNHYMVYTDNGTYRGTKFTVQGCKDLITEIIEGRAFYDRAIKTLSDSR